MTIRMQQRLTRWGDFEEIDLPAIGAGDFVLSVSYSHAARLTWTCLEPQHTAPIPAGVFIRVWLEGVNDPSGDEFTADNPLFVGYVEVPEPAQESIGVSYTAYDPTFRSTRTVTIFNRPWPFGDPLTNTPPERPEGAVPQLFYNVQITNDPAWAHQVGQDGTLGQLLGGILDYTENALVWCDAAPGDGTELGAESAYVQADLDALTVRPQEKLDFSSESPFSAIQRCMRYDPRFRCVFDPAARQWRFHNITAAPTKTITLNTRATTHPPVSLRLLPSTENCITAISIYGPPSPYTVDLRWEDAVDPNSPDGEFPNPETELTPLGSPTVYQVFFTAHGQFEARFWNKFIVTDPTLRSGSRELPTAYEYQNTSNIVGSTTAPLVLLSYDYGATWIEWPAFYDTMNGVVTFARAPFYLRFGESGPLIPGSTQTYFCPNAVRLIWAPYGAPLEVRRPVTGYEGTAYEQHGFRFEKHIKDEALMVGREFGIPVTTAERRAAFEVYAQTLLDQRKDVVWTGVAVLDGLDWDYCRLNKKVQILAEDGSGNPLTTGWEAIEAYATDAEFNLEEQTTSITFSADRLALFGKDEQQLKEELRIRPLQQMIEYQTRFLYAMVPLPSGKLVNQVVGVETTPVFHYVDDPTAQQQAEYNAYQQAMGNTPSYLGGGG